METTLGFLFSAFAVAFHSFLVKYSHPGGDHARMSGSVTRSLPLQASSG